MNILILEVYCGFHKIHSHIINQCIPNNVPLGLTNSLELGN